jgi:hypothetical protein
VRATAAFGRIAAFGQRQAEQASRRGLCSAFVLVLVFRQVDHGPAECVSQTLGNVPRRIAVASLDLAEPPDASSGSMCEILLAETELDSLLFDRVSESNLWGWTWCHGSSLDVEACDDQARKCVYYRACVRLQ